MTTEIQKKNDRTSEVDEIITKFHERQIMRHGVDRLYDWKEMMEREADERMLRKWKEENKTALNSTTMVKGLNNLNYDILYLAGAITGRSKAQIAQYIDHEKNGFQQKASLAHIFNKGSKLFFIIGLVYSISLYLNTPWVETLATFAFVLGMYCVGQTARWSAILLGFKQQAKFIKNYATSVALEDIKLNMDKVNLETTLDMNKYQVFSKVKNKDVIAQYFIEGDDKSKSVNKALGFVAANAILAFCLLMECILFYCAPFVQNSSDFNFSPVFIIVTLSAIAVKCIGYFSYSRVWEH